MTTIEEALSGLKEKHFLKDQDRLGEISDIYRKMSREALRD